MWCWRFEIPLDCKEIKPVNAKGNQPLIFTGKLMLKLKLQPFGHLMWRTDSLDKTVMLGKIEGRRRKRWQRMWWLDGITNSMGMGLSKLPEFAVRPGSLECCSPWGHKESDMNERLNWTDAGMEVVDVWEVSYLHLSFIINLKLFYKIVFKFKNIFLYLNKRKISS